MAEIRHTPGPWRAEHWRCHEATTLLVDDASIVTGARAIAEFETEEDARVAAALPELIAAVIAAERVLTLGGWRIDNTMDPEAVALAKCRAAIAKATEVRHGQ